MRIYVDIGIGKRMKAKSGLAENHFADTKGGPAWELGQYNEKQSWGEESRYEDLKR